MHDQILRGHVEHQIAILALHDPQATIGEHHQHLPPDEPGVPGAERGRQRLLVPGTAL